LLLAAGQGLGDIHNQMCESYGLGSLDHAASHHAPSDEKARVTQVPFLAIPIMTRSAMGLDSLNLILSTKSTRMRVRLYTSVTI
jgi:hypothetical protein